MKGILGRKAGMTQVFTTDGTLIPVTVVVATPNVVLQKKTMEKDGYEAVKVGFEDVKENRASKPSKGIAAKANTAPKKVMHEFKDADFQNLNVGDEIKVDVFKAGDKVDVQGTTKGHGYAGTIERWNAHRQPETHGGSKNVRHIGSLATTGRNNGRIEKGTHMAGQYGNVTATNQNLEIIEVNVEENYLLIKGNVPGPRRGLVIVKETVKPVKSVDPKELIVIEEPVEEVVEEVVAEEAPVEEVVAEEPVVEEVVAEEPVVEEAAPVEEAPVEEAPAEEPAPTEEAPAEAPAEEEKEG